MKFLRATYPWFGLAGSAVVSACILIAALAYSGRSGEAYSVFNHFISELGEVGVSRLAWLFNGGLIAGGLLFLAFSLGLGLALPGWWSKLGLAAGAVAAIALAGVGLFPMNRLEPHVSAAQTYFRAGLVSVICFGLAIQLQPPRQIVLDRRANLATLLAAACYGAFLVSMPAVPTQGTSALDLSWLTSRPAVWPLALLEWSIFFGNIVWFSVIAAAGRQRPDPAAGVVGPSG